MLNEEKQKLYEIYTSLTKEQQKQLLEALDRFHLATDINKDPKFLYEAIEIISKDFPFLKQYIMK